MKKRLHISLFGRLRITCDGRVITACESSKAQELFCYLLLHSRRSHARERIASLLWEEQCTTAQAKAYLRKALWQLQQSFAPYPDLLDAGLLEVNAEWIKLNPIDALSVDVAALAEVDTRMTGIAGQDLATHQADAIRDIVDQYNGELLENWSHDWCLVEREFYKEIYLRLMFKLMAYCEASGCFECGIAYGKTILRYDCACEHAHRMLMRLYYHYGARTDAIRQYARCADLLRRELDIAPSPKTTALYEQIKSDALTISRADVVLPPSIQQLSSHIHFLKTDLLHVQEQVEQTISRFDLELRQLHGGMHDLFNRSSG